MIVGHPSEINKHQHPIELSDFVKKTNGLGILELTLEPKGVLADSTNIKQIVKILENSDIKSIRLVLNKPEEINKISSNKIGLALGVRSNSFGGDESILCGDIAPKKAIVMPPIEVVLNCPSFKHPNVRVWNCLNRTMTLNTINKNNNIKSIITDYPAAIAPHCVVIPQTR